MYWRSFWLGCFQLSVVSPAFAAELHWEVPEGCPDVHALEREAEQVLGEPLTNYPLNMVGSVTQSAGQLSLSLRITLPAQAETRERALQAASCQELLEAAAVALALAAAESGERAAPAALPQNTEPREPPPGAAPIEPQDSEPSKLEIGAAGTSVLGIFPQLGLGGELQLAWTTGWLRLGLAATWFPERSMQVNDDLKVSFGAYFAQLLWCGQHNLARTQLYACATASFGQMGAHLDRPSQPRTTSTPWRAVGIRLGLSYPILPPLELTASLALVAPFTRPRFYMQPASIVLHEPALLNAQLLLGVLFSL